MKVRSIIAIGGIAALGIAATGCGSDDNNDSGGGSTAAKGGGAKIAFLLPESKTTRYEQQDKPAFLASVKKLCADCEVLYENASQDPARQQQQAESVLTNGAKALVIDAVDVKSAAAIATRAKQAGVPVISYGRLTTGPDVDYFISIDPYRVGQQQARALLAAIDGGQGKRVVMINGSPSDSNAAPYKKGAHDVLEAAGVKVVKEFDTPDWSPDKAQTEMEQAITSVGKNGFDAVYVANDGMAGGVIAAMKGAGIDPATRPVTGQDAELAGVQRILAGEQLMTVYQPISGIAEAAAKLAVPLAQGKTPPAIAKARVDNGSEKVPSVLLDTVAVNSGNVQQVIDAGFLTAQQICTAKYASACDKAKVG